MPSVAANEEGESLEFFNVVDGKPRDAKDHDQVVDPRSEELLWKVPIATAQDLDDAVDAANRAFKTWKTTTNAERKKALQDVAGCIRANKEVLATVQMRETGKSWAMASSDIEVSALHFDHYTGVTLEDEVQYEDEEVTIIATHAPIGVLGAISPWNFPMILSSVKIVSALITGNCVIIKPSPFTPYAQLKFCELAQSVLPAGVFQTLSGGADLGERMTLHGGIQHISFTGTTAVGRRIQQNCARATPQKRVILEMAGNDACVVCEDADLARVVPLVALGCFFHAGQVCVASKRVYVHEALFDRFVDMLVEESRKFAESDDAANLYSPLSNRANFERARGFVEDCRRNNYKIVAGGEIQPPDKKGFWLAPTIVSRPPEDALVVREEQFGPIAPVMSWTDEEDVIARANLDNAGLGASVYTPDLARAQRIARRLEAGSVWINRFERPHPGGYFGGWKDSGVGGELGRTGLYNYCQIQSLHIHK
ncbi:aldehyde dehydrogenase [Xylariaceae sp. FL0804]|nr:aldehyde dehydrogenase [Xylariaceae sp. FL0804]